MGICSSSSGANKLSGTPSFQQQRTLFNNTGPCAPGEQLDTLAQVVEKAQLARSSETKSPRQTCYFRRTLLKLKMLQE
jgi:hypothetical protein